MCSPGSVFQPSLQDLYSDYQARKAEAAVAEEEKKEWREKQEARRSARKRVNNNSPDSGAESS